MNWRGDTASLKETSIDVAVWENTTDLLNSTAVGVEMCECPQGYAGNSCQDPAEGYCRKRQPDFLNSVDDLALVGYPQPCACNGHSTTCERETCRCTVCYKSQRLLNLWAFWYFCWKSTEFHSFG